MGKFHHDLTATEPWKSWLGFGESSPNGRTIQVSEILSFTQIGMGFCHILPIYQLVRDFFHSQYFEWEHHLKWWDHHL